MKKTLLEIVQDILDALDYDEVNSIDDTIQSAQVASIIENCYWGMISKRDWAHLRKLFQLESVGSVSKPVYLKLPERTTKVESIKYKTALGTFREIKYKNPDEFLYICNHRFPSNPSVAVVSDFSGVQLNILKDAEPSYWTSFDDVYVVFDSFDEEVETTVQASNTQCLGYITPVWSNVDDFIPDLPIEAFPALFEEAKSTASLNLKQMVDQKAENNSMKQQRRLSQNAWRAHDQMVYPNYGRRR